MFKLILRNTVRHRLRAVLTILGMAIAILSFGLLRTVVDAWYAGVERAAADRLITRNAISLIFRLPLAYLNKIKAVPGVKRVAYGYWFGGIYIDEKNFFPQFAVDLSNYLDIYSEFVVPDGTTPGSPERAQRLRRRTQTGKTLRLETGRYYHPQGYDLFRQLGVGAAGGLPGHR